MKNRISISQIKKDFAEKKITPTKLVENLINKIEKEDVELNSIVIKNYENA